MIFEKIANGITKHYKKILVIWIIALLISVPALLQVDSVVQYSQTEGASTTYESLNAQDIISQEFQTSVANGTIIIVLQSDNVTDAQVRDFVLALQEKIQSSSDIKYMLNVTSAYSVEELMLNGYVTQLGPGMHTAQAEVNESAFLLYGIPYLYASTWEQLNTTYPAYNVTTIDAMTYQTVGGELGTMLEGKDNTTSALAYSYYDMFALEWNNMSGNVSLTSAPMSRASAAIAVAAPELIAQLPSEYRSIMTAVLGAFDMSDYSNQTLVHAFTLNMVGSSADISNMTFLQQVYDLGSYDSATVSAYTQSVIANGTLSTYPVQISSSLLSSFVASNKHTMLFMISFSVDSSYTTSTGDKPLVDDVGTIRDIVSAVKSETGSDVTTYVTGDAAISADMQNSSSNDMKIIEPLTIMIIIVLMGILFRSVLAQWLPLGAVGVALGISEALVFVIGTLVANVQYTVLTILFTVLMGVGTDYSIFIMTRYREERIKGATRQEAVHTSVMWAGESIVTSGATVIIAFLAMSTASYSMVQTMGLILGMAIIVALLVALTLVPSLLMLVGNRIFWPTTGQMWKRFVEGFNRKREAGKHGYFYRAAKFSVSHAKVVMVAAIVISVPAVYLFMTVESSYDFIGSMGSAESTDGMTAMSQDFGAGKIMPTQVIMQGDTVIYNGTSLNIEYMNAIENITATIAANSEVQSITSPTRPYGELVDYRNYTSLPTTTQEAILADIGSDNKTALITVVLTTEPMSSKSVNLIPTLRSELADAKSNMTVLSGTSILVGGSTATIYDISVDMNSQFSFIEMLVIVGIFVVLMIVLGSLLLPAFAVISIAMSISWSFAATYLIFDVWLKVPLLFMVPLILFVMLMGIGMDYNVFILTRIREEAHKGKNNKDAVVDAVDWTGGIITALALIMGGAFGSMMLSSNSMLQEFGFALAFAILIDAMVVRTYIVPAAMTLMGDKAWWAPGRLQRVGREKKLRQKEEPKNGQ